MILVQKITPIQAYEIIINAADTCLHQVKDVHVALPQDICEDEMIQDLLYRLDEEYAVKWKDDQLMFFPYKHLQTGQEMNCVIIFWS